MALNLRIEVFFIDLFRTAWCELGLTKSIFPRHKNYDDIIKSIICPKDILPAVYRRYSYIHDVLKLYFNDCYCYYSKNDLDIYNYFEKTITNYLVSIADTPHLHIFDKLIMACSMIIEMAYVFTANCNQGYKHCAPLCLVMYFDSECKDEFYDKGGWKEFEVHAKSYTNAWLFTKTYLLTQEACYDNAKLAFIAVIGDEYSADLIKKTFEKNVENGISACACCECMFYVMWISFVDSSDEVNYFKQIEGYLQLIRRLLPKEEILESRKSIFQNNEIDGDYLLEYKVLNTHKFLCRLFVSHDADHCMHCGRNKNELLYEKTLKSDKCIEKIKSAIHDTMMNIDVKSDESNKILDDADEDPILEQNMKEVLQLFSCLGTQPGTSRILSNLRKSSENQLNDDSYSMPTQKGSEGKGKEKKKRNRRRKKIDKDC